MLHTSRCDLESIEISEDVLTEIDPLFALQWKFMPIQMDQHSIKVAISPATGNLNQLRTMFMYLYQRQLVPVVAMTKTVEEMLDSHYGGEEDGISGVFE